MHCAICKKPVSMDSANPYRPFCSERCQMIDLGRWAGEDYRIAGTRSEDSEHPDDRHGNQRTPRDDAEE